MREQIMFDVPSRLTVDEVKQVFRCLSENPERRPHARHLRFFNPAKMTVSPVQVPRERLDPGPPLARGVSQHFVPKTQAFLVTHATNSPDSIGKVFPLERSVLTIGRRADQDIMVPEPTVSGSHCTIRWQAGCWTFEDPGSTNGTYGDTTYERRSQVMLMHNSEVQLGELRLKLVSFQPDSAQHERAKRFLQHRDGLTLLLNRSALLEAVAEEQSFCHWADLPLTIARYELRGPNRQVSDRPTILEMLALRRAALRSVELTETLLLALTPVVAGRSAPMRFAIGMAGPSIEEARTLVEQVVSQVQGLLPDKVELLASIVKVEPGMQPQALVDT